MFIGNKKLLDIREGIKRLSEEGSFL